MKHTIKTGLRSGVIVSDAWCAGDEIFMTLFGPTSEQCIGTDLTDDQASALIFALERALEARQLRRDRVINCAGDALCSAKTECPTPVACGVGA